MSRLLTCVVLLASLVPLSNSAVAAEPLKPETVALTDISTSEISDLGIESGIASIEGRRALETHEGAAESNRERDIRYIQTPSRNEKPLIDSDAKVRIDQTLQSLVDEGSIAGVSALIYENGGEAYFNAFGMADTLHDRPMARDTIVQIFSMTKPVTGVALMQLYEEGRFQLDDPVAKFLPAFADLKVATGTDDNGDLILQSPKRPMTIRDLTRHTSGLANGNGLPMVGPLLEKADPFHRDHTLADVAQKFSEIPLWFHPGQKWAYGPSVDIQARLVERLSGMAFEDYLRQHILDPLKMNQTRYRVPKADQHRMAAVYLRDNATGKLTRQSDEEAFSFNTQPWALTPGGWGLTATIDDYMRFARMLQNEGELDGVRILKPETVRLMATDHLPDDVDDKSWLPGKGQVGFGIDFAVRVRPPASAEENFGVVGEFFWDGAASTLFWVDPANDLTAVLFVQLRPFDQVGLHKAFRDAVYGANERAELH
ncbi:serine hydrolase domain-containing protein [Crateriforma spongiae]|uniref:serine hydrolase domain-containing protein n=1 Tax=Crateriforma spongiae TaxID=2724528 RepID=UPI0014476FEB|nr:serine hydrolase domain-containing protein [Crateriforma spongiae]